MMHVAFECRWAMCRQRRRSFPNWRKTEACYATDQKSPSNSREQIIALTGWRIVFSTWLHLWIGAQSDGRKIVTCRHRSVFGHGFIPA
jgi:hypothetical protein